MWCVFFGVCVGGFFGVCACVLFFFKGKLDIEGIIYYFMIYPGDNNTQ